VATPKFHRISRQQPRQQHVVHLTKQPEYVFWIFTLPAKPVFRNVKPRIPSPIDLDPADSRDRTCRCGSPDQPSPVCTTACGPTAFADTLRRCPTSSTTVFTAFHRHAITICQWPVWTTAIPTVSAATTSLQLQRACSLQRRHERVAAPASPAGRWTRRTPH
jgi:hypothetical protein